MRRATLCLLLGLAALGCADERPRAEGTRPEDAATRDAAASDGGGRVDAESADAGGVDAAAPDASSVDAAAPDAAELDAGARDAAAPDAADVDAATPDAAPVDSGPTSICGNGQLEPGESCDDGVITSGCDSTHDGGDGACLPLGQCSQGFLLDTNGDCVPEQLDATVIIDVDNFCNMNVTPAEIVVPTGQTIMVDWFNRSRDYAVDVWMSYGGGYLDLPTGATWDEPIPHCTGPNPHTEYADISTACSSFRFYFRCQ